VLRAQISRYTKEHRSEFIMKLDGFRPVNKVMSARIWTDFLFDLVDCGANQRAVN